jgi:hypothetical protein
MSDGAPGSTEGASKWLDTLDKANRLGLIPLILALAIGYMHWTAQAQYRADLQAAEARTREALSECRASATAEHKRTREEVRKVGRSAAP